MKECLMDALIDSIKLLPFLLVTFIILEFLEHKISKRSEKILFDNRKYGPIVGGLLGGLPQCGFSTMAANLFSGRVITIGTLVAVFLSTSDEMLPIMISEHKEMGVLLCIVFFKILVGIIIGLIVDGVIRVGRDRKNSIHDICVDEHCSCDKDGIVLSSIKHTIKIGLFILIANVLINIIIFYLGEDKLRSILINRGIFSYFIVCLFGMIPNCASSVILTELYLANMITIGHLLAGLLPGSGLGLLILFKMNKNKKENLLVLSIIFIVGLIMGILADLII